MKLSYEAGYNAGELSSDAVPLIWRRNICPHELGLEPKQRMEKAQRNRKKRRYGECEVQTHVQEVANFHCGAVELKNSSERHLAQKMAISPQFHRMQRSRPKLLTIFASPWPNSWQFASCEIESDAFSPSEPKMVSNEFQGV